MAVEDRPTTAWVMFTPAQLRAARALLKWTREDLAKASGVSAIAIKTFEQGDSDPRQSTLIALRAALSKANVVFLDGESRDPHGPGVAFRDEGERKFR